MKKLSVPAKAAIITGAILLISAGVVYATRKKKPVAEAIKKVGKIIWPEGLDSSQAVTESGESIIRVGDSGRYVEQLQDALNELHKATAYINKNCGIKWGYYTKLPTDAAGNIVTVTGKFDDNTAAVSQFYLARKDVELEYLQEIRERLSKYRSGDKCIYPLSISI